MKIVMSVLTIMLFVCVSESFAVHGNSAYNHGFSIFARHNYVGVGGRARVHIGMYHPRSHSAASPVGAAYRNVYGGGVPIGVQHLRNYDRSVRRLGSARISSGSSGNFGSKRIYSKVEMKQIKKERYDKRKAERIKENNKKNYVVPFFLE